MTDKEMREMLHCGDDVELSDFQKELCEIWAALPDPGPWTPHCYYCDEGDLLEVLISNESHYANWRNHDLTTMHSQGDSPPENKDAVIGFQIWFAREWMAKMAKKGIPAFPSPFKPFCYYGASTDVAHVCLSEAAVESQTHPFDGFAVDYDKDGAVVGFHLDKMTERTKECKE